MQGWRLQRACQELACAPTRATAPGWQLLQTSRPHQQREGLLHVWRQSLLRKRGEFTLSFGILPLCWTLGLVLPSPVQSEAAWLELAGTAGTLQRALVQHTGLCDCSRFLT